MEGRVGQLIVSSVGPRALGSEDSAQIGAASREVIVALHTRLSSCLWDLHGGGMQEQY